MKKIIYSPGEPSGIGPDLIIQLCTSKFWTDIKLPVVCLADPKLLTDRASKLGKKIKLLQINNLDKLQKNKTIVSTAGKIEEMNTIAKATPGDIFQNKPIIILINSGSASAAEILASALSEHNRAISLGTKTFGKGSIQTLIPITNESAIKITTGLYYTPRGNAIQAKGVTPDVIIPYTSMPESNQQELDNIVDESQLYKHLKTKPKTLNQPKKTDNKTNLKIANQDFQLYQAIKLLQGMVAMHD